MYASTNLFAISSIRFKLKSAPDVAVFCLAMVLTGRVFAMDQHLPSPEPVVTKYQVVHGWPRVPEGMLLGQVSGVGVDSHNHVFVFRRAENSTQIGRPAPDKPMASPAVLMFDGITGAFLSAWGEKKFILPHGLVVDRQDNIWLTDIALHQVFKFDHSGKLLLALGESGVPGFDSSHFNKPTDVAVSNDGTIYVSDGYGNNRVVKLSPEGRFLLEWGTKGTGRGQFDLPHAIALDASANVYVADRSNARIQVFNNSGKYLTEWKGAEFGRPWAVRVAADGFVYVVDGGDLNTVPPDRARVLVVDLKGKVVNSFGRFGNYDGQFVWPHDVAVGRDGAVYVGDVLTGMRVQKFVK